MKKILLLLIISLFLYGCSFTKSSPKKEVELLLNKYQKQDSEIIKQLDNLVDKDNKYSEDNKKEYKELMKKQYKDLTYKIKDEVIDGDEASVEVEIEVYDYYKGIDKANQKLTEEIENFKDENGNIIDSKYTDLKIKEMKDIKDRVNYTINITLTKKDNKWKVNDLSETDLEKIHGIYNYK